MDRITTQLSAQEKALSEKMTKQINDSQKSLQDKLSAQEKGAKDLSDKIGWKLYCMHSTIFIELFSAKLEKTESSNASKGGGETAKLATLTKAIDSIQENSKSLETMGNNNNNKDYNNNNMKIIVLIIDNNNICSLFNIF